MSKQEEIREVIIEKYLALAILLGARLMCGGKEADEEAKKLAIDELAELHSQGVVIKVERELPYKWGEITRKHSYSPYSEFTIYTLSNKYDKMFGYIQKYQSLTGYECFKREDGDKGAYEIYLGGAEWAHIDGSASTLEEGKGILLGQFLESKDNPDNEIPTGYVKVEPLIKEKK